MDALWVYVKINGAAPIAKFAFQNMRVFFGNISYKKLLNYVKAKRSQYLKHESVDSYPPRIYIEPTNTCNLRCPFCMGYKRPDRQQGMMDVKSYKKLVDEIAPYTIVIDLYNRGESLMHPDICEFVDYAKKKGIGVKISSNFHKFDKERAKSFVKSGLDLLVVAVDGADQKTYEKYRVRGDLEKVLENIRLLVDVKKELGKTKPVIVIRSLVMRHNEHQMDRMKKLASELGVDNIVFAPMMADISDEKTIKEWLPEDEDLSVYDYGKKASKVYKRASACPELWTRGMVHYNGTVIPCCLVDDDRFSFGNAFEEGFAKVWNNESFKASRKAFKGEKVKVNTVCTTCLGRLKEDHILRKDENR